jgi:adenylate cyclase
MKEIERKYLIEREDLSFLQLIEGEKIKQAYIQNENSRTVRVRTKGEKAFLTVKIGNESLSRDEFEYQIPVQDALSMMEILQFKVLSKTRYEINFENHLWEIDVFEGKLDGLIIAEIELKSEDESFITPPWVGTEVTNDSSYLNAKLIEKL